ncbi:MAG: voltage-gated chloride channel protein [Planctomycetota bacterium]|nr:MAG: voltage-gated chloride channel protein [Planctomycetota bacterium]
MGIIVPPCMIHASPQSWAMQYSQSTEKGPSPLAWLLAIVLLGSLAGSACALFLHLLDYAQASREAKPWLLYLLPLAGAAIVLMYQYWGGYAAAGMGSLQRAAEDPQAQPVPARRMAPLILLTTVLTHLFGGSAGREGTAVQMGGSIASAVNRLRAFQRNPRARRMLLCCGMAAGFSGLFGTPLAATIFAVEVARLGRLRWPILLPALLSALLSNAISHAWGASHALYPQIFAELSPSSWWAQFFSNGLLSVVVVALGAALAARLYLFLHHGVESNLRRLVSRAWLRPVIGGLLVIALVWVSGSRDYLGLGVTHADPEATSITSAFSEDGATHSSWLWKIVFTAVTLGSGFKGGEVTPLFFIGATLGHSLALMLGLSLALAAGLGMMAVFAAASRCPLACAVMGAELFGWSCLPLLLPCCYAAVALAARQGIYSHRPPADPDDSAAINPTDR